MNKPTWSVGARTGPIRRHKKLVWFACEGLIALYDERRPEEEDYMVLTPSEFTERAEALDRFGKKQGKADPTPWQRQESREMIRAAADMDESVKEAKNMGDPSDPTVQAFWAKHRRSSRISMSDHCSYEHGTPKKTLDQMAAEGKGNKRGPLPATAIEAIASVATENVPKLRRLPKKKPRKGKLVLDL